MKRFIPLIVAVLLVTSGSVLAETRVEHRFEKTISAEGIRRILVETKPSDITIRNGDSRTITVSATIGRDVSDERDVSIVQEIVNGIGIEIETVTSRATIRPKFSGKADTFSQRRKETHFRIEILVPTGTHVEVHQSVGEVDISGVFGDVDVSMRVGEIRIDLPKAKVRDLRARTKIGEVKTHFSDRIITREGIFPDAAIYENPAGDHTVRASLHIGDIDIRLRPES